MTEKTPDGDVLMDARIQAKIVSEELERLGDEGDFTLISLAKLARNVYGTLQKIKRAEWYR
jgi:hypothetical protein